MSKMESFLDYIEIPPLCEVLVGLTPAPAAAAAAVGDYQFAPSSRIPAAARYRRCLKTPLWCSSPSMLDIRKVVR